MVSALIVNLMPQPSHAQQLKPTPTGAKTGLIPREILFGNPDKSSARISPDGKNLSFLAPSNGVMNVWVGPVDDVKSARPVSNDRKRGIRTYFWVYTNQHILYLQDADGDENYHVYAVDLKSGKTEDLTPLPKVRAEIQEVSPHFPNEVLVGLNNRDPSFHDIYRLDVATGKKTLVLKNTEFAGVTTDDDFNVRFGVKFAPDGSQVLYQPDGKSVWKEYLKIPSDDTLTSDLLGFDKTGKIAYFMDSRGRNTGVLTTLDLDSGKQTVIAENKLADVGTILQNPQDKTLQGVSFTYDRTQWQFFDPKVEADFKELRSVAGGDISVASRTADDSKWIVSYLMDDGPTRFYLYDRAAKNATFLFTSRKELEDLPLQKMHPAVITARDGLKLVSYLTLPEGSDENGDGRPEKAVPMVLYVHGGPWARDNWGYNPVHQFLANRGYAVLSVNFRGSTGFGKEFVNAANKEWAGKMHNDLLDAVAWSIKEKIAVPEKIGIMGGSYGGYATLVGLTFTPDTFACGVDIVGPSNLITLLSTIPPYWAPAVQMFKDRLGDHTTEDGKKMLQERSPLNLVDRIKRPLLIGQGANDPRVKQAESDQIVKAMQERKIPVTYVLFPDEGHGFARPQNRLAFYAITEAFLAQHLGGRFEAIGDAFTGASVTVPAGANDIPGLPQALKTEN